MFFPSLYDYVLTDCFISTLTLLHLLPYYLDIQCAFFLLFICGSYEQDTSKTISDMDREIHKNECEL